MQPAPRTGAVGKITVVEPWVVVLAVVLLVFRFALRRRLSVHARQTGLAARERLTGSTEPSTVGTCVVAAVFAAFGLYLLVFQTSDVTKGVPGWLSGGVLVVGSVVVVVDALRRR